MESALDTALFYLFAVVAMAAAVNVLLQRRVFYSALSLIVCLTSVAGVYMLLQSPFIATVQVIVYAGAIMVLFLFVIMLLDPFSAEAARDKRRYLNYVAVLLGLAILIFLYPLLNAYELAHVPRLLDSAAGGVGSVRRLAAVLFDEYLLPFELTSVLILVAIVGAVVLARRQAKA
ncbi:MAG: NADH-quinone oxidoreductase subunit J [Acidobacteria bacterium]|nr:NADH-quinone oxidoreductase subunit J [Acidobacteriota bacterium]